jgi:hypothetical protein
MLIEVKETNRGFKRGEFTDHYGMECSIQESSIVSPGCLWLGLNDAKPLIMARDTPQGGNGWVPYPLPEQVMLHTRMHITQEMAAALIPLLQHFVETSYLPKPEEKAPEVGSAEGRYLFSPAKSDGLVRREMEKDSTS